MVSPLPDRPVFHPENSQPLELTAVIRALFPALLNQARFKPGELIAAQTETDRSRFLIMPVRTVQFEDEAQPKIERYAIASGALAGFGGFLEEKFRAHDYQLGRRNCQQFLRSTFGLSPKNILFDGEDDSVKLPLQNKDKYELAIIPRRGYAGPEVPLPPWPQMSQANFRRLMIRIKGRLSAVAPIFVRAQTQSRLYRAFGGFGFRLMRGHILQSIQLVILSDLVRRDQIAGYKLPASLSKNADDADNARHVLAELFSPAHSFRTSKGIAKSLNLPETQVRDILNKFRRNDGSQEVLIWTGIVLSKRVYTAKSRRPRWYHRLPVIGHVVRWLNRPTIDEKMPPTRRAIR
jgi:hypothetical protein